MMSSVSPAARGDRPGLARAAEAIATLAVLTWIGGLIALGAIVAPEVFGQLEREPAGQLMGTIFRRFDAVVLGCVAVFAVAEIARIFAGGWRRRWAKGRAFITGLIVTCGVVVSAWLSPQIDDMFARGVRRGVGAEGAQLDAIHRRAESVGKVAAFGAVAWLFLGAASARRAQTRETGSEAS